MINEDFICTYSLCFGVSEKSEIMGILYMSSLPEKLFSPISAVVLEIFTAFLGLHFF